MDQETIAKIKEAYGSRSKEDIYAAMIGKGYKVDDLNAAFVKISEEGLIEEKKAKSQNKAIAAVISVGVLLIGAGVFSFIASNWDEMPKAFRVALILSTMLAFYIAAWVLNGRYRNIARGLFFLGNVMYGANIFLIAQIFNIRGNWPDGFLYWMLGTLALAYALEDVALYLFASLLAIVSVVGLPIDMLDAIFNERYMLSGFSMTSTLLLFVSLAASLAVACKFGKAVPQEQKKYY